MSLRPGVLAGPAMIFEQWADTLFEDVAFRISTPGAMARLVESNGGRADVAGMYRFSKERKFGVGCIEAWRDGEAKLTAQLVELSKPLVRVSSRTRSFSARRLRSPSAVWGPLSWIEYVKAGWVRTNLPLLASWYERMNDPEDCVKAGGPRSPR